MMPYQNFWGSKKVGQNCKFGAFIDIGNADFGDNCKVQAFCAIPPGWHFGNSVFIGQGVVFINDKNPKANGNWTALEGYVEDNVSIGSNCTVFPVRIGRGAIIGAGSVVLENIQENDVVAGNPAKKINDGR